MGDVAVRTRGCDHSCLKLKVYGRLLCRPWKLQNADCRHALFGADRKNHQEMEPGCR